MMHSDNGSAELVYVQHGLSLGVARWVLSGRHFGAIRELREDRHGCMHVLSLLKQLPSKTLHGQHKNPRLAAGVDVCAVPFFVFC